MLSPDAALSPTPPALTTLLWRAAAVWLVYSLLGGLAVACAVPGQQVAPLYVPAGLALVAVATWGRWMLLPIALGGFTVDAVAMWSLHPDQVGQRAWLVGAAACGLGAALQAWAGWRWVTGGRAPALQLDTPREIGRFLLLAGAAACCINATLAVSALVWTGWIPAAEGLSAAAAWWAGDVMGVALGAPLGLTLIGQPAAIWRARRLTVGLPLALAIGLLGVAGYQMGQAGIRHEAENFRHDAAALASQVRLRLNHYTDAVSAPQGWLPGDRTPDAGRFVGHATPWLNGLPGADGLLWLTRSFAAGQEQATVNLVAPLALSGRWQGWNALGNAVVRPAFERARREDQATVSAVFDWPGPAPGGRGVWLLKAAYRGAPYTPQARVQAQVGALALALDAEQLSQALLRERPAYMAACLLDTTPTLPGSSQTWLGGTPDCLKLSRNAVHQASETVEFGGREWRLRMWNTQAVPTMGTGLSSWVLTSVGVGFSAALGALLLVMTSHARHLKAARDEAQARREEAERANRAKSEFMSRMSHELRTPLNAVLGFAQVIEMDTRDPLSPGQKARLSQIQQAGWNLLAMIDDVLDIARLDTGALRLQSEAIFVGQELQTALRLFAHDVQRARLTLHAPETWPSQWCVMADAARLRQILGHLLSNAIKFNNEGGEIWLDAREVSQSGLRLLRISVRDNGQGLNPEQMAQLFQPFSRVAKEHGPTVGRGVGLAISRHLAQLMGGELEATGHDGRGATFTLTLPLCTDAAACVAKAPDTSSTTSATAPTTAAAQAPAQASDTLERPRRVLYVEDNQANSEVLRAALANRPAMHLTVAATTEDGLAAVHDRLRGGPPDLILLDVHLPDASGLELLGLLKSNPATAAIPVIMISADALPEQIDAALAAGAACYLTKPVQLPALLAQMDELMPRA
jgi:signal transduction histidine kinase/ActR/RegA family two-component response regulator